LGYDCWRDVGDGLDIKMNHNQINTMTKTEAHIRAADFYLCKPLPEDFDKLDEQEVTDFIQDNKWEPFERWEPHGIWELIETLASEFLSISNENN
jgi:hypothetical protein